jgi:hypothetical protein
MINFKENAKFWELSLILLHIRNRDDNRIFNL